MNREKIDSTASQIFGPGDSEEKSRWIRYWQEGRSRYNYYFERLQEIMLTDFTRARILDLGCGSGGLESLLENQCRLLVGLDYKMHILRLTSASGKPSYVQGNGIRLPFPDACFDFIFAFDVLEHLNGGSDWQNQFLAEVRRVMAPLGMAMISTPNFWYPYDAHSRTYFSQFMPTSIADRHIGKKNPEFIKEHESFKNIRLLRPGKLKRLISSADLVSLHSLPCCLDKGEYSRLHPVRGILSYLGMGWLFHAEFWMLLTRKSDRRQLRTRLKKNIHFKKEIEETKNAIRFEPEIDFARGSFYHQIGKGWHWPESENDDFRWIKRHALCFLETSSNAALVKISGYTPINTRLSIYCDDQLIGIHPAGEGQLFKLAYPLPWGKEGKRIFTIGIKSTKKVIMDRKIDSRELSVQIFSIGITE